jgi:RNA polymerase sigma factor (sigma-70 family)
VRTLATWNANRGAPFLAWATTKILGEIRHELRAQDPAGQGARHRQNAAIRRGDEPPPLPPEALPALSLDWIEDMEAEQSLCQPFDAAQIAYSAWLRARLRELLTERQWYVVERHYWGGWQKQVIARVMGVDPTRVSQIHRDALSKIRQAAWLWEC